MMQRVGKILVGWIGGVHCQVRPFCPQTCARFTWECVAGYDPIMRAKGGADSEDEALAQVKKYANLLASMSEYWCDSASSGPR